MGILGLLKGIMNKRLGKSGTAVERHIAQCDEVTYGRPQGRGNSNRVHRRIRFIHPRSECGYVRGAFGNRKRKPSPDPRHAASPAEMRERYPNHKRKSHGREGRWWEPRKVVVS